MHTPRFYTAVPLAAGASVNLNPTAAQHALRVLRLKPGDAVVVFNGERGEYRARIARAGGHTVNVVMESFDSVERESPLPVGLGQAISAGERMDYTLRKAVELGVAYIQPLASARSVVKLRGERAAKRVEHWQNIVISACEQCRRNRVPTVAPIADLDDWLAGLHGAGTRLLLSPDATVTLREVAKPQGGITLLVGAEGGFSEPERGAALVAGFNEVRLGARVLRTETAALAALAALQTLWGDF
ncbi:MAG: 16S rRNA (uracil(1498)-N(3))-methyltransferase [Burkholderiales bacterium]